MQLTQHEHMQACQALLLVRCETYSADAFACAEDLVSDGLHTPAGRLHGVMRQVLPHGGVRHAQPAL